MFLAMTFLLLGPILYFPISTRHFHWNIQLLHENIEKANQSLY